MTLALLRGVQGVFYHLASSCFAATTAVDVALLSASRIRVTRRGQPELRETLKAL